MLPERRAPQRALVVDHFAAAAPYWRDIYASPDVQGTIYRERRATAVGLADGLGLPLGSRVLEIGCGAGSAAVALAQRGHVIHALDRVPTMIELTRRLAIEAGVGDRVVASLGDVHHLGFADGTFDLVLALGVTPWLDALEEPLREVRRVLRPGGHLIVSADNRWRLNAILDPRWFPALAPLRARARGALNRVRRRPPTAGVRMYAVTEFDRLLEASGLCKLHGRTLGFGPFSLFNLPLVSEPRGVRVHHALQRLADRGTPLLRAAGSHYLVVAQRAADPAPPASDHEATTPTLIEMQACR
jgi:SAM-dependent methyltransferase